ncbi:MAG: [FeFe] hydrogenase H-cluster radical SAM maturase HydE [Firmicutes bacterium]|nr:[FeFe] hydrogenase H-cluster radical SAM maturase HydE [Bacillota bacterium]
MQSKAFWTALEQAKRRPGEIDRKAILALLEGSADTRAKDTLFHTADEVRHRYVGDEVYLRGIIEFSNYCVRNCHYCGLRAANAGLQRYRMSLAETVGAAEKAARLGVGTVVLQSGEDPFWDAPALAEVVREIKRRTGLAVTLSVGDRPREDYALWREAGADRYLLKHETADPELFRGLRPGTTLADRLTCIRHLRELGYQVGSGNMVGLPGQTLASLADDIVLLQELDVEMAGIGPFIPHPQTPLAASSPGEVDLSLRVLAVARLAVPWAHIPATTALGTADPQGRQKALRCGANVVMPNVGPTGYRPLYQIYPGKICLDEMAEKCLICLGRMIGGLGRATGQGPGHSPKPRFLQPLRKSGGDNGRGTGI